jgi:D-alanyl-D-alanine carboxypeptidase/D-alanyl-D-alanine-endopeptidase (penicillin-binding protein 4)
MDRRLTVKGTIRRATGEPYSVPVDYPQLLLGRVFADRLRRAGVQVDGKVRMVTGDIAPIQAGRLIAATQNPLGDALLRANRRSLNMAAEGLLLRAGNGTWGGSSALMDSALTKAFGLRPGSLRVRDGSGLSKMNLASPEAITSVLVGLLRYKDSGEIIRSLPVSGGEGSLRKRMNTGIARGRVYAKTGTLSRVSALSGYVTDAAQRPRVAFSILVNRVPPGKVYQARRLQDDICRLLVEYAQSPERRKAGPRPTQPGPLHKDIRIKPRPLDESAPAR